MIVEQRNINKTKYWATIGIIISWATFWMFLLSPFGILAWGGILIYLIVKKHKLKRYLILSAWLFVPSCSFLTGTIRYTIGNATLQGVGGPEIFHGIDRETRVAATSSGCLFVGFEPFVFPANNTAVRLWTNLFGFQRGSYKGILPTQEEAQSIIKSADTLIVKYASSFIQFDIAGETVKIDSTDLYSYRNTSSLLDTVVGKVIKDECFVFQQYGGKEEYKKPIYIVDINKSKLLKVYVDYY
jgi:hypothetical protein